MKWFNDAKGYGFISPADSTNDVFVHFSGINGKGHRQLEEGQEVDFDIETGDKGPFATNVDIVAADPEQAGRVREFLDEIESFPFGLKDQVDAAAGGLNILTLPGPKPKITSAVWGRTR